MPLTKICTGDAITWLRKMAPNSIHCCVTSPPYFGLRDYGTARWEGGDPNCLHRPDATPEARGIASSTLGGGKNHTGHKQEGFVGACPRCGAVRFDPQIGLESTPAEYVAKLVEVFEEVRRVLRPDGTLWLNLGDSYANDTKWGGASGGKHVSELHGNTSVGRTKKETGLKSKDLIGIPWRVAFALQAQGWYLRQDIIWAKPNPMPESVRDRCTKSHEYLFLLSKSEKYYFDNAAIAEDSIKGAAGSTFHKGKTAIHQLERSSEAERVETGKRNRRSVWTIAPKPYKEAHFATFPPALVEPCIKAGSPVHGIVLDPFAGAGTTGVVAKALDRMAILIELNPDYVKLIEKRLNIPLLKPPLQTP